MGRPKGSKNKPKAAKNTSPRAVNARINGRKGGRPRGTLPGPFMSRLGPAPIENPILLARWYTAALGLLTQLRLEGYPGIDALADEVRKNASASGRVIPHDIQFEAARIVRNDEDDLAADGGPEEEAVDAEVVSDGSVRAVG